MNGIPRVAFPWLSPSAARPAADRHLTTAETAVSGRFQAVRPLQRPSPPVLLETSDPGGHHGHRACTRASDIPGSLRDTCTSDRRDPCIPPKRPFLRAAPPLNDYQPSFQRMHCRPSRSSKSDKGRRLLMDASARCLEGPQGDNLKKPLAGRRDGFNTARFSCKRLCRATCQT